MEIFWYLMAAVAVVLVVAAVTIVLGRRRAVPPAPERPELPAEPGAAEPPVEAELVEPVGTPAPAEVLETPEAPTSRLARLRRRLSASTNPFARGLLGLLSADRLDAADRKSTRLNSSHRT